ncbi:putative SLX8 protein [Diplogelasinospora grovesii]|uniref:SLX8 protein n=1 Tax=Diplogelasinospora grovesii TaxID=303347 RepID=A0AAN6S2U7_9PEZI|nr:putative SLX8 protein [Diplogelasinospora grovesii]
MSTRPQRTRGGRGSRSSPAVIDIASGPASSPPSSRRRRPTPQSTSRQTPTRRPPMKRKRDTVEDSSIEDAFRASDDEGVKVIDLANADQMPPPPVPPPKPKNEVKLSAFQCVICMDDVTDLTVTHCGHLFCSECLHSSLHIESHKRICPICRQKIDPRPANGQFSVRAKGYYPLELKLVTKKSLGKRPVR